MPASVLAPADILSGSDNLLSAKDRPGLEYRWTGFQFPGFVTEFDMAEEYLAPFEVKQVGARDDIELWVPSEDLPAFNKQIKGHIRVVEAFYGEKYEGEPHDLDAINTE